MVWYGVVADGVVSREEFMTLLESVYHLRNIIIRTGVLTCLRFTYDFEIGPA
eukprot:COSAG01_NODE_984_length_12344_cov_215.085362_4_plen_52_part_00